MIRQKINRDDFLQNVSNSCGIELDEVSKVYEAIVNEIRKSVCSGKDVALIRFGTFSLRDHKGHPVQFKTDADSVSDYVVLKFRVSDVFIKQIRDGRSVIKNGVVV